MSEKRIKRLFDSIANSAAAQGIAVTGGHTEITVGLDRPIVVGTMLGEVSLENLVRPSGARKGDLLLMIKPVAIEGTSILAREKSRELSRRFGRAFVKRCAGFLHEPGISVVRPALAAARAGAHALHDPTEGGLLTGAYEIARASRVGLLLDADAAQILPETRKIADFFSIDPLGLIASGTLLAAFDEPSARRFLRRANALGGAWVIGRFEGKKILVKRDGKIHRLEPSGKDEILKAL
jgi:hydrogenase maturation factor